MKKRLVLLCILLVSYGMANSQEDKTASDSTVIRNQATDLLTQENEIEAQEDDEISTGGYVPGLLHSSQDVYANNASYNFSIAYFRMRGYDSDNQVVCINGLKMNNLVTGRGSWSQWGGLNHVTANYFREEVLNLSPATFTFGGIAGASNMNMRASAHRKQIRASYSISNRTYVNRLMLTASTGLLKSGWAFSASLSKRWGNEGYVPATFYDGYSYFGAIEKKINNEHSINLTAFGAPTKRGMQAGSVQEVYDLTGSNYYNANWGYQGGKKRNARVRNTHEPVILLTHYYTPQHNKFDITSTLGATFGKNNSTALNWYDAPDPRPDYYRYLPSYQEDPALQALYTEAWLTDYNVRQINWDGLYNVNQMNAALGERGKYMVENREIHHMQIAGASSITANINEHIKISGGVDFRGFRQRNYKTIDDLLGGLYWIDVDNFAERDFPGDEQALYNDLNNIGAELHEGDKFGYDYALNIYKENIWAMSNFTYNKIDFNVGASISGTQYWRTGYMKNGRFPEESYGNSAVKNFINAGVKAGITYKINGRNYLILNGTALTEAPGVLHVFLSPRIRNSYVSSLKNEKIFGGDLSYVLNYPVIKLRVSGFFTQFKDQTKLSSFYHDVYRTFVNYSMTGMDTRHMGVELGAEVKLGSMFSIVAAGNFGDYRYTNRPDITITVENGSMADVTQKVYIKNFYVTGSPQIAGTLGLKFNYDYWWVNINGNYFDKIYVDINPERRTSAAISTLSGPDDPMIKTITEQTKAKGQFTLDASVSKSWRIKRYTIGFNFSVTNILNNRKLVTTGYEQYRFDYTDLNVNKFPPKYYYALGRTFFFGLNFTFN